MIAENPAIIARSSNVVAFGEIGTAGRRAS
jgi:hypothetical protein